jgi:predicted nucleic acid-binding protein
VLHSVHADGPSPPPPPLHRFTVTETEQLAHALDTNVLIALLDPADAHHDAVEGYLDDSARALAELRAVTRSKMPDVVVLFTALSLRAALTTADLALMRAAVERDVDIHRI